MSGVEFDQVFLSFFGKNFANFKILWLEQYKTSQELQMLSPVIDEPAKFESKDIALVIPNQMISVDSVDKSLFA